MPHKQLFRVKRLRRRTAKIMKIAFSTLFIAASCALVTSCYPPYPPYEEPRGPRHAPPVPRNETTLNDEGQRQLDEARRRLEAEERIKRLNDGRVENDPPARHAPPRDIEPSITPPVVPPVVPSATYQYASKIPGKPGYVFNPFTQNQVDVRGIPSGTLVRDPNDSDPTHKFRVP